MAKVQDYGKDTVIDIDSVLYFKADHKYTDVMYRSQQHGKYWRFSVQWSLLRIRAAHSEFEQTHRGYLVRRSAILSVTEGQVLLATQDRTEIKVPCSRRLLPHIRKIADANSATT